MEKLKSVNFLSGIVSTFGEHSSHFLLDCLNDFFVMISWNLIEY